MTLKPSGQNDIWEYENRKFKESMRLLLEPWLHGSRGRLNYYSQPVRGLHEE